MICIVLGIKKNIVSFSKHFKDIHYNIRPDHDIVKECFISQRISATKQNPVGKQVKASKPKRFQVVKVES